MQSHYGKVGILAGLSSFILLVIGMRNVLGQTVEIVNFIAFSVFGLIIGISAAMLLFYKLRIAFAIFIIAVIIAFFEMFRSYTMDLNGMGADIGILSLFIISSFGLGLSLIVQFIIIFIQKQKRNPS